MAIGSTGAYPLAPIPQGSSNALAPSRLARGLQDAFGFRSRSAAPQLGDVLKAEPLDNEADRRQFNLEHAAEQIRRLNPFAPRGAIVDIVA